MKHHDPTNKAGVPGGAEGEVAEGSGGGDVEGSWVASLVPKALRLPTYPLDCLIPLWPAGNYHG